MKLRKNDIVFVKKRGVGRIMSPGTGFTSQSKGVWNVLFGNGVTGNFIEYVITKATRRKNPECFL